MKFTEEQYHKIVNTYELQNDYVEAIRLVLNYVDELKWFGYEEAIAIANPLTREWAHDKFVEKEKKYYWTTKKADANNQKGRLFKATNLSIKSYFNDKRFYDNDTVEQLTKSEIKAWGYNPEMFDREEVK